MVLLIWMILGAGAAMAEEVAFVTMTPHGIAKVHEGAGRTRRRLAPCSTFKIPNAVIGLETGVIPGPDHVLRPDTALLFFTDGMTWKQRKSDLRKIVEFQNSGGRMEWSPKLRQPVKTQGHNPAAKQCAQNYH